MTRISFTTISILMLLVVTSTFSQNTLQPLTHHNSPVVDIQQHPERPWIISVSDRGGLRV